MLINFPNKTRMVTDEEFERSTRELIYLDWEFLTNEEKLQYGSLEAFIAKEMENYVRTEDKSGIKDIMKEDLRKKSDDDIFLKGVLLKRFGKFLQLSTPACYRI